MWVRAPRLEARDEVSAPTTLAASARLAGRRRSHLETHRLPGRSRPPHTDPRGLRYRLRLIRGGRRDDRDSRDRTVVRLYECLLQEGLPRRSVGPGSRGTTGASVRGVSCSWDELPLRRAVTAARYTQRGWYAERRPARAVPSRDLFQGGHRHARELSRRRCRA